MWFLLFFFFKQKTAYEMRISDWSSDVCSSDLFGDAVAHVHVRNADHALEGRHQRPVAQREFRLGKLDAGGRQRGARRTEVDGRDCAARRALLVATELLARILQANARQFGGQFLPLASQQTRGRAALDYLTGPDATL